jgi:ATP-binding cassette, subfamily B, bacterial
VRSPETRRIASLFRPYRLRLTTVLALIGLSAGISMISPFLLREVLDKAIPERDTVLLTWLVGGMIVISIATGALGVAQTWLSNLVGQRVMHDLRAAVYRHLQRLSLAFFTRTRTGEVQSRIANDIGGIQNVVTSTATSIVSSVTTVLATIVAMFLLDWRLAAFSLALLPFFVWLTRRVGRERKRITSERQGRLADMSSLVEESLSVSGILLGKTMGRAPELAERFTRESADLADLEVRSRMAGRWRMASVQMAFSIMPALVYWFAGYTIAQGNAAISIGTVVAFTTLQTRLFFPLQSLLSVGIDIQTSLALFHRIFEYLDLEVDIAEREDPVELDATVSELRFESVSFGYDPDGQPTLDAIDLVVPAGTTTAIVGETGSGKTTFAKLLTRLMDPVSGGILLSGVPLRDVRFSSLRSRVVMVPQDGFLFDTTIGANVRYGRPGASDADLLRAFDELALTDWLEGLEKGLDTRVGERGGSLSAGERQLVALARAYLADPDLLVLDEATSAVDPATEVRLQRALEGITRGRTAVSIAHRLSTAEAAEEVIVFDQGRIVQRGPHEVLVARPGRYADLYASWAAQLEG